jgi:hypothetical protein
MAEPIFSCCSSCEMSFKTKNIEQCFVCSGSDDPYKENILCQFCVKVCRLCSKKCCESHSVLCVGCFDYIICNLCRENQLNRFNESDFDDQTQSSFLDNNSDSDYLPPNTDTNVLTNFLCENCTTKK